MITGIQVATSYREGVNKKYLAPCRDRRRKRASRLVEIEEEENKGDS